MKNFSRLFFALVFMILIYFSITTNDGQAMSNNQLSLDEEKLVDWVKVDSHDAIFGITSNGNLHKIDYRPLEISNTISIGENPSDIYLFEDTLYIALPELSMIKVVNLSSMEVVNTIDTSDKPYRVAANGEEIYYAVNSNYSLYNYNIATEEETKVVIQNENYSYFSRAELFIDNLEKTLYVAETGLSGSDIYAISTEDYSLKDVTTFDDGYGFPYPKRYFVEENEELFYAGHKMNKNNLEEIFGVYAEEYNDISNEYSKVANIVTVDSDFVYSTDTVYDKDTFRKVGTVPNYVTHILSDEKGRFMYNANESIIFENDETYSEELTNQTLTNNKLQLNQQIDDWVLEKDSNQIYAISARKNELLFIDTNTMEISDRKFIGSFPTDIDLVNGKLYISLFGSTKVAITEPNSDSPVEYITTKQNPYEVETDGKNLYYTVLDQWLDIYHIDLLTSMERVLEPDETTNYNYYETSIKLDKNNDILYIGESGLSGSDLYVLNTVDGSHVSQTDYNDGYGFSYPGRSVFFDETDVYYAGHRLQKTNVTNEKVELFESNKDEFVSLEDNYIFSSKKIFDKETNELVYEFPNGIEINKAIIDSDGSVFLSVSDNKAVYKFDSIEQLQEQVVGNLQIHEGENNEFQFSWDELTGDGYKLYARHSDQEEFQAISEPIIDQRFTATEELVKSWFGNDVTFGVKSLFGENESSTMDTISNTFNVPIPKNIGLDFEDAPSEYEGMYGDTFFVIRWDLHKLMDGFNVYVYSDDEEINTEYKIREMPNQELFFTEEMYGAWEGKTVNFEISHVVNGNESDRTETFSYTFEAESDSVEKEEPTRNNTNEGDSKEKEESTSDDTNKGELEETTNSNGDESKEVEDEKEKEEEGNVVHNEPSNQTEENSDEVDNDVQSNDSGSDTKRKVVNAKATVQGDVLIVSDNYFDDLEDGSELEINVNENNNDLNQILLTEEQIRKMRENRNLVSIIKKTTSVTIPASIFEGKEFDTKIIVNKLESNDEAISDVFDFTISQGDINISEFSDPVTLSFKVNTSRIENPENVKIYYYNEDEEIWELVGGTYENGVVTAQTSHFSVYSVFEKRDEESSEEVAGEETQNSSNESVEEASAEKEVFNQKEYSPSSIIWVIVIGILITTGIIVFIIRKRRFS
ncbi:YncE family protein [Virgibacillus salinus]|uniref:LPXTG-motif cell wall anchor domain-containing protein n=1 Tax=Virgibacillus salinus TaxID=553311 RepID=A0A1H1BWZ8_9BACI|nr:hypothetical protein [Virgibacillus salinus]SDQ56464.1 hypothetical protein SAMN05216231_1957 [Virgibacillus salinus]